MCYKAVNRCFFVIDSIPDQYKTQEISHICYHVVVSSYPFLKVYCLDKYKTQKMCDEAVDDCLAALKFIPDWFVTSKNFLLLCTQMMVYSFLMKILVMIHFVIMKWVFLV